MEAWSYGKFSLPKFLNPLSRAKKIAWFRKTYRDELLKCGLRDGTPPYPCAVAHSFGTYILGTAMLKYKYLRFDKIILCGSILPQDFDWGLLIERGQVRAVRNEYGIQDLWARYAQRAVPNMGPSGELGFTRDHSALEQEQFDYSHSEYFEAGHMQDNWIPFLEPAPRAIAVEEPEPTPEAIPEITTAHPPDISISHLPVAPEHFVGREAELEQLDQAWDDPTTNIISIVAFGGVGKSALVAHWLQQLANDQYRGARRVYGHSFYSQGSSETSAASADEFIEKALEFFGEDPPHEGSPWDKGLRLAKLVRAEKTLLILDGLEPLQQPPNAGDPGIIKDPALQALVRELAAANPGLCVISTREKVTDIPNTAEIDLEQLSDQAGAALLEALGVNGTRDEREQASAEVAGHGLALTLLGTYIARVHGGDVRKRDTVNLSEIDEKRGGHAKHQIQRYEQWFGDGPEVSILRLLGLFDRPAEDGCIQALRDKPAIPDLTDAIASQSQTDWNEALANLRDCGLIAKPETGSTEALLDAHPVVREHFKDQLNDRFPEAAREAHRRLYLHLKKAAPELPDTLPEMTPLYHAVTHGCAAGLHANACRDVYHGRVNRGNEFYSTRKLGAFGADLAAVACFFEQPWDKVTDAFTGADRAWIISLAGYRLRALGRLDEAVQCMGVGLRMGIDQEDWKGAAIDADNLSELYLTRAAVADAVRLAEQSVELADHSEDAFSRMVVRTKVADVLHQALRHDHALAGFREAESRQADMQPQYPLLYSLQGCIYCDLLLDTVMATRPTAPNSTVQPSGHVTRAPTNFLERCQEVRKRAEKTLEWEKGMSGAPVLDFGLHHLTLGRTHLLEAETRIAHQGRTLEAETEPLDQAQTHLDQSVDLLRRAGQQDHLSRGLLARAALFRVREDFNDAERDLSEAESIADRAGMLMYQVDVALERCRLALAQNDRDAARDALTLTKELVKKTEAPYVPHIPDWEDWDPPSYVGVFKEGEIVGYHRHNHEITRLQQLLT